MRMRPRRRRRLGQVIIPALFLFPTLMLFVYLIYETAKLSREKIRHQFAIDAAVFVEMTNYSDFLNRTAYVNGAFPMRIFDEGFYDFVLDCSMKAGCDPGATDKNRLWTVLCKRGVFPQRSGDCVPRHSDTYGSSDGSWNIRYGGDGSGKNSDAATIDEGTCYGGKSPCITILTGLEKDSDANSYWINWDDANQIYKLYVQIYQLLGSVEDAQYSVLNRLAQGHNFLKKSYWLNTGSDVNGAAAAANIFGSHMGDSQWVVGSGLKYHCYQYINFYGNKPTGSMFQPWQVFSPEGGPIQQPSPISGCGGLFQLMTVSKGIISSLNAPVTASQYGSRGVEVNQPWGGAGDNNVVSKNYFNHDFMTDFPGGGPAIHVSAAISGYGGAKPSVWPDPTPKFQVRTSP